MEKETNYNSEDSAENTGDSIEIQNGTWRAGLAARVKEKLAGQDIEIKEVGNTQTRPTAESGIYVISAVSDVEMIKKIQSSLNIPLKDILPEGEQTVSSTNILIILGEDYKE